MPPASDVALTGHRDRQVTGSERRYTTSQIAQAAGVHPNTVRLYERIGLLAPIARTAGGYRSFSERDLAQMRIARLAVGGPYVVPKTLAADAARHAALDDCATALELAERFKALVAVEEARARRAAEALDDWASVPANGRKEPDMVISEAAEHVGASTAALRDWERNGLIAVRRDPRNGYRRYTHADLDRLRVIRLLLRARYSAMSILRMMTHLDRGGREVLSTVIDTPRGDETVYSATDRWLSSVRAAGVRAEQLQHAISGLMHHRD